MKINRIKQFSLIGAFILIIVISLCLYRYNLNLRSICKDFIAFIFTGSLLTIVYNYCKDKKNEERKKIDKAIDLSVLLEDLSVLINEHEEIRSELNLMNIYDKGTPLHSRCLNKKRELENTIITKFRIIQLKASILFNKDFNVSNQDVVSIKNAIDTIGKEINNLLKK